MVLLRANTALEVPSSINHLVLTPGFRLFPSYAHWSYDLETIVERAHKIC